MGRDHLHKVSQFIRQSGWHLLKAFRREESPGEVLSNLQFEARRLSHAMGKKPPTAGHRDAVASAKRGTKAYNKRDYLQAETWFRKALEDDPSYARAHTYLGNALYKQDRHLEAAQEWRLATRVDPDSAAAQEAQEKLLKTQQHQKQRLNEVIDDLRRR